MATAELLWLLSCCPRYHIEFTFFSAMAFFNLTRLGLQDPIKSAVTKPGTASAPGGDLDTAKSTAAAASRHASLKEPVYPNSEANGSHVKYTTRLHKHIRPKLGKSA